MNDNDDNNKNDILNNTFINKINYFINKIDNTRFIFDVTKCCEYSEYVPVFKKKTLYDLYDNVSYQFGNIINFKLFIINEDNEKLTIKPDETIIYDYILQNPTFFKPIYPLPMKIVYKIYIDDGLCHNHN